MTDQEKITSLTRKLEEAKGALEVARGAILESFDHVKTTDDMVMAEARLRDVDAALASLTPEQPEKPEAVETGERWQKAFAAQSRKLQAVLHIPGVREALAELKWSAEAVETGEPVAWRVRLLPQFSDAEWFLTQHKHEAYSYGDDYEVQPLYASPVSDGEARRKVLREAANVADTYGNTAGRTIAARIRALAATPTAGDATAPTQPKRARRPTIDAADVALHRLGEGDTIGYSQDGEDAYFREGDRAWVADDVVLHLRGQDFLIRKCDDEEDYRGLSSYDAISPVGRAALAASFPPTTGDAK